MPEYRFNPAPGWPEQPPGWIPPKGWRPDPSLPPAPEGWQFWIANEDPYAPPADHVPASQQQGTRPSFHTEGGGVPRQMQVSPKIESFNGMPVIYTRQQHGHSVIVYSLLLFVTGTMVLLSLLALVFSDSHPIGVFLFTSLIFGLSVWPVVYWHKSPNHFWRA